MYACAQTRSKFKFEKEDIGTNLNFERVCAHAYMTRTRIQYADNGFANRCNCTEITGLEVFAITSHMAYSLCK